MPNVKSVPNPEVEEVIEVERERRAVQPNVLDWCSIAVEDMARSVERLNRDLDAERTNNVIWRDVLDIFSLRRWAFVFPGGGAARGGRIRRVRIRPAQPTPLRPTRRATQAAQAQATQVQVQAAVTQAQAQVVPPPPPANQPAKGRVVIEAKNMKDKR